MEEEQSRNHNIVDSPEFKSWFGDSKVVDSNGNPLIVYHGTSSNFDKFDLSLVGTKQYSDWGKGIYLTPSKSTADYYRTEANKKQNTEYNEAYRKLEDIKKDIKTINGSPQYSEEYNIAIKEFQRIGAELNNSKKGNTYHLYVNIKNPLIYIYQSITDPYLVERAKENGHDGVFILTPDRKIDEIIAFSPNQIKSASTNTKFDINNDSIMENENPIKEYPLAGKYVSDLEVRKSIPNIESISASMTEYKVLKGIREIPISEFFNSGDRHSKDDYVNRLAYMINESKEINPLIVVIDKKGPYILEGSHRLDALHILGILTFPALVVIDEDINSISESTNKNCFESTFTEKDGRIFINPYSLTSSELSKINTFMKRKGYDWRGSEDALKLLLKTSNNGYSGDMADAIKSAITPKKQDISTKASRHFGVTTNPKEAGYMTPRGTLLDFSGRKEGGTGGSGTRSLDHSEINAVTGKSGWEGKLDFMNQGNIRLYPENGGVNLTKPLTQEQRRSLGNWFRYFKDKEIPIEINKEDGERSFEKRYPSKISPYVILKDIDNYFSGKSKPLNEGLENIDIITNKFINFLTKFKNSDSVLIEAILNGYFAIYEHSTEERVKEIEAKLKIKPINQTSPLTNNRELDSIISDNNDQPKELDKDKDAPILEANIAIYRGISSGSSKYGSFYSLDKEFARNFTHSGRDSEIIKKSISTDKILKLNPLPFAGNETQMGMAIEKAKETGFSAILVDEGKNQPNSVFIF